MYQGCHAIIFLLTAGEKAGIASVRLIISANVMASGGGGRADIIARYAAQLALKRYIISSIDEARYFVVKISGRRCVAGVTT